VSSFVGFVFVVLTKTKQTKVLDLFPATPQEIRAMSLGVNVMLRDGSRGDEHEDSKGRAKLSSSQISAATMVGERGNPLRLLFRDPPHLQELPRPVISGTDSGLTT
jgi:hypothetical protein